MGRMHSQRKGQSKSTRPARRRPPEWNKRNSEWVIEKCIELARKGVSPSMIGLTLRDEYGVASIKQIVGKSVIQILRDNNLSPPIPEDLLNLIKQAVNLRKHLENNKHDLHSKFGLQKVESKIHRLSKYYRKNGVLDPTWKYSPDRAELLAR